MGDARVPIAAVMGAFGLAITVTLPAPNDVPIQTTGAWFERMKGSAFDEELRPYGSDFQRLDPRKILGVPRTSTLTDLPEGTTIAAPEYEGGEILRWRVDGYALPVEIDLMRVNLVRTNDF